MPAHNAEAHVQACVDSVMAQADAGVEVLLVDDASTDGTPALLQALAAQHGARLRLLRHASNRGVAEARNTLLDEARGSHVWFIDADDLITPTAMPRLRELLASADAPDLVFCDYRVLRETSSLKHRLRGEHHRRGFVGAPRQRMSGGPALLQGLLASGNVFCWTHVARRELWGQGAQGLRFPSGRTFEDMATVPHLMLRARSAWYEPQPWVLYRRHPASLSAQMSPGKVRDLSCSLAGLRDAALARWPDAPSHTRFAVAHQATRNFIAARRHARGASERKALLDTLRSDFLAHVGEDLVLLRHGYLRRGWWWRAWVLNRALRERSAPLLNPSP